MLCPLRFRQALPAAIGGTLTRGKISREKLEEVIGPNLLAIIEAAVKEDRLSATERRRTRSTSYGSVRIVSDGGDSKGRGHDDKLPLNELTGTDKTPGKLQVR